MNELEQFVVKQIDTLQVEHEKIEFRGVVGDNSYMIEFFLINDGVKRQCYEMVDDGTIDEDALERIQEKIAKYYRSCSSYIKGKQNKINFTV